MSLGRREARHETVAAVRTAGVKPEDYWDFKPGQKVMTADGFPGTVASVDDGPIGGAETYDVVLDNGMGGGQYTASLLRAMPQSTANVDVKTAADDYPELGTILLDRPPLQLSTRASLQAEAAYNEGDPDEYTSGHRCPDCGSDRSLESANGVIKCENCGHAEQNGEVDGWGKAASLSTTAEAAEQIFHNPNMGATCARCGFAHRDAKPGDACLLCDGQMSKQPDKVVHALLDDPYRMLLVAGLDEDFRFHVTATWSDVRSKAKRIRTEGGVNIIAASSGTVVANVKGDHHVYETEIVRMGSNAVAQWHCGCKWAAYAWGRQPQFKRFEGRMCSHALALHFEAQSQGMFGRTVQEEEKAPGWLKSRTRVVTDFDRDQRKNVSRPAQPRKRDLMRTHAAATTHEESPAQTLARTAFAQGVDPDEVIVSFAAVGIDGSIYFEAAAPDGYQKTKPGSHHKDRSGDLAPCARGGCGHPEGIHGEEGGHCDSQGCACTHYQGVGAQKEARRHRRKKKPKKHTVRMSYGAPWHGIGIGYWGGGWGGWGGSYSPGESGGGDGGSSDGGGGDGGGATASLKTAAPLLDTMDPTYTPGNEVRDFDGSHGTWGATRTPNPNANPGSTGFASTGDPKEFNVDSSAFGRMGSATWPRLQSEALVPKVVKDFAGAADKVMDGPVMQFGRDMLGLEQYNRVIQRAIGDDDYTNGKKPLSKNPLDWVPLIGGGKTKVVTKAPKYIKNPSRLVDDIKDAPGKVQKVLKEHADDVVGKQPPGNVKTRPQPPAPRAPSQGDKVPGKPGVGTPVKPDVKGPKPETAPAPRGNGQKPGGRTKDDGPQQPRKPEKPQRQRGRGKGRRRGRGPMIWPGLGQMPRPDYYQEYNGLVGAGHGIQRRQSMIADLLAEAALSPQEEFANGVADTYEALGGSSLPRYEAGFEEVVQRNQEADADKRGIEALLDDEPEAALPMTDGTTVDPNMATDPDGDAAGMASHGMAKEAWDRDEWDEANDPDGDPCPKCEGTGLKPSTSGDTNRECGECDGSGEAPSGRRTASVEAPSEAIEDIVAQFQATAGALAIASGSAPGNASEGGEGDVASAARAFLAKESMKTFSPAEQKQIIDEGMDVKAANLDRLNIEGTHYEALEAALASQTDDDDLEL